MTKQEGGDPLPVDEVKQALTAHAAERGLVPERSPEASRRLALLWEPRPEPGRGRKPRHTLDDVAQAGIAVAKAEGLDALSMRRVAAELGIGAMSLYTYVPGRDELVDVMIDRAYAELDLPAAGLPWRDGLRAYGLAFWNLYHVHPWLLQANFWRVPLGPHVLDAQEAGLRTIAETGLAPVETAQIIDVVDAFVQGLARAQLAERADRERTGQDIEQYWTTLSSFWVDYFDVERYPTLVKVYTAGGFEHAMQGIEAPLDRLLDAIALMVERARDSA